MAFKGVMVDHSEEYKSYINSSAWRMKRALVIFAAGCKCERCGSERGLQVHHKHYDTLGHEKRSDLEVLCPECHRKADRERAGETAGRIEEARFDGWARKVYGEYYEDSPDKRDRFDAWLERQEADW